LKRGDNLIAEPQLEIFLYVFLILQHTFKEFTTMSSVSTATRLLTARWVLPVSQEPVENGGVEITGDRIVAVHSAEQLKRRLEQLDDRHMVTDCGKAIISPGFINLHTHVEWTAQELFDTQYGLFDWIPDLTKVSKTWSVEDFLTSAAAGVRRIARSGTSCILDSSYTGQAAVAMTAAGLRGVVALELFGIDESQAENTWNKWQQRREQLLSNARISDLVKISVAPHAPYTVSPALLRKAADWAQNNGLPLTMHLAESKHEFDWIQSGDAVLDAFIKKMHVLPEGTLEKIAFRNCGKTPVQHLDDVRLLGPELIAAHAVQLTDNDVSLLARRNVPVAHCPRSNARLRNGAARLRTLMEAGIKVGFGTDSAASTDDLDVLSEARFGFNLARALDPQFPFEAKHAIEALTIEAARAIGMSDLIGSLEPGKQADIAIFNIVSDGPWAEKSPYDALLYGNVQLQELFVDGRKVASDGLY
jgi:5-methylthioadenosine/S-adenosylhomocysteine deaminase